MKRKTVRIISLIIAAALLGGIIAGLAVDFAYAETDQEKRERLEKEKRDAQEGLAQTEEKKEKSLQVMESLEKEIADIQIEIDAINARIAETEELLAEEEIKLQEATAKAEEQYEVFKERFRVMCEQGDVSIIAMLLTADGFNDLIDKAEIMKEIAEYDKAIFDSMEKTRLEIEASRDAIAEMKESLEADKAELEAKKATMVAKQSEQRAYMAELESDAAAYQKVIDDADAAMESMRKFCTEEWQEWVCPSERSF